MSDKPEPQEKGDSSLWGDIARMEAEVYDPEEIATSVYDVSEIAGLKAQMEAIKAKRKKAPAPEPLAAIDDDDDDEDLDDEDEDQTLMYSADKLMEEAKELALAKTALAKPRDDDDDEDLQTAIVDRESLRGLDMQIDDAPSIDVAEASLDADLLADLGEDSSITAAPISKAPISTSEQSSVADPPADKMPSLPPAPEKSALAAAMPFIALVIVGFLVGYLIVAYMRPPG